jgi:hypothetical protein
MPTPSRRFALVVLAALAVTGLAACSGAGSAASPAGSPATAEQSAAATTRPADFIDHPTGSTDVVLRVGEEGGFMMMEFVMARVPKFTLYGDGRVLISTPVACKVGPGGSCPPATLREAHLTEDQVQAVLRGALVDGQLGVAKEEFPVHVMDVPTTVIELHAGGVDKAVKVAGLGMDVPPGPDAAVLTSLATLVDRLMAIPTTDDYTAPASVAVLAETEAGAGATAAPWPWPDLAPSDFAKPPPDDPFGFTTHVLTATQADALGITAGDGGGPFTFAGPDTKTYTVVVRPALPEEIPAAG